MKWENEKMKGRKKRRKNRRKRKRKRKKGKKIMLIAIVLGRRGRR
jgi:hypothetical protein